MDNALFIVIIIILLVDFFLERFLGYLNRHHWKPVMPDGLSGICSPEEYEKSRQYFMANYHFNQLTTVFYLTFTLFILVFGLFGWLDDWIRLSTSNYLLISLLFFGIYGLVSDIISSPFDLYQTFIIEKQFGFNKTTLKLYVLDKLKGWLLALVVGGGLISLILWIYKASGPYFWLLSWAVVTAFLIFVTYFYSSLIVPLFNKQRPLEEGELRIAIEAFSKKVGFRLRNIFVMDASKRSTKGNAYFSGFGPNKRIVLFDTLIEKHSVEELVAVLAHEIGHYKKHHITTGMLISIAQTGLTLWLLSLFIGSPELSAALGGKQASFHMGLIGFFILYSPVSMVLGLFSNVISRKNEFAADEFAARNDDPDHLMTALTRLSTDNLSNLNPHPAYIFFHYSHPPLVQRLKALGAIKKQKNAHGL